MFLLVSDRSGLITDNKGLHNDSEDNSVHNLYFVVNSEQSAVILLCTYGC